MQVTCPCCYAKFPLDSAVQHDAASEMQLLLAGLEPGVAKPLIQYLSLFRPAKNSLGWSKALSLSKEALELTNDKTKLGMAFTQTVLQMRDKQQAGEFSKLTNHRYLARVLETVTVPVTATGTPIASQPSGSKLAQAHNSLEALKQEQRDAE